MENAHIAKASGKNLGISRKHTLEIANYIRGKDLAKVKKKLEAVLKMKEAIPFKRFQGDVGHRKGGMGTGRFPQNATREILKLLESAESNAQDKGLNSDALVIESIVVNKGTTQWRHGRQRRRQAKRTHVDVILAESESKPKEKKAEPKKEAAPKKEEKVAEKPAKKETPKTEEKPVKEEKKEAPKKEKTETPKEEKKEDKK